MRLRSGGRSTVTTQMNPKNILKLTSDATGNITLNGDPIALHQIKDEVVDRVAENDKLVVSIESHPESRYEVMVAILDEVKKAKAPRVSLKLRRL